MEDVVGMEGVLEKVAWKPGKDCWEVKLEWKPALELGPALKLELKPEIEH